MVKCIDIIKRIPIKRLPIILGKGILVYWIAMSETTSMIGRINIRHEHSSYSLMITTLLISLMIGIIIELTREI